MPRFLKYLLFLLLGVLLGFFYLQKQAGPQRLSLESGLLWTAEEVAPPLPTPSPFPQKISLLFGGDLMFDRHIRKTAQETGYLNLFSEELKQLLAEPDLVIANLEGPITERDSISIYSVPGGPGNTVFTFDPEVGQLLKEVNIHLVNLGNNHIFDLGADGIESTLSYLNQAEVEYFGWLGSRQEVVNLNKPAMIKKVSDFTLGFVNYNQFGPQDFNQVLQEIEQVRPQVDYLTVYTHWGAEYVPDASELTKQQARQAIDMGADLVIGTHPHVIQPHEDYQQGRIYYSLGNFVFDQYFRPEVTRGQLVQVQLERENSQASSSATFQEFEVVMQANQPIKLIDN